MHFPRYMRNMDTGNPVDRSAAIPTERMVEVLKEQGRQRGAPGPGCTESYHRLSVIASGTLGSKEDNSRSTPELG